MSRVDTAIKAAAGVTVVGLAGIAGAISYSHMTELAQLHGETGWRRTCSRCRWTESRSSPRSSCSPTSAPDGVPDACHGRRSWQGPGPALPPTWLLAAPAGWAGRSSGWPAFALLIAVKLRFGLLEHKAHDAPEARATVPDDVQKIVLGQGISWTDEPPGPYQGPNGPNAWTDEPDVVAKSPLQRTPRPGRRKHRTGAVDESSAGRTDHTALEATARAAHAALADEGTPVTRDALAARLRDAGQHRVQLSCERSGQDVARQRYGCQRLGQHRQRVAAEAGIKAIEAESAVLEAQGHASGGDEAACAKALDRAERAFDKADRTSAPQWIGYFDESYLAAKFGHCFSALGRGDLAQRFAERSLDMDGRHYARGKQFNLALLATAHVQAGEPEQASVVGLQAVDAAEGLDSMRAHDYLSDLANRLAKHAGLPAVRAFIDRARPVLSSPV